MRAASLSLVLVLLVSLASATQQMPSWQPTWAVAQSTIVMPCNDSGLLDIDFFSQFGVVDIDWSNAKQLWVNPPMQDEELMARRCNACVAASSLCVVVAADGHDPAVTG
jgi:hypothetical protein